MTVRVRGDQPELLARPVERALGNPFGRRPDGWHGPVAVVPGGHRPGRPDQLQQDRARARQPLSGARRVVVLGCTVGAGQTTTALMTGTILASLRAEPVATLDLNPGEGCLATRARAVQPPPGLEVITRDPAAEDQDDGEDVARIFELVSARYPVTLADPGAAAVPRVLAAASQLVLVAPANDDAARGITMTREWLEAHGHAELADGAIIVLNGVRKSAMAHVEHAEAVARGRFRAIVRVPWDDQLGQGTAAHQLHPAAMHAYTALAGVLVASLSAPGLQGIRT